MIRQSENNVLGSIYFVNPSDFLKTNGCILVISQPVAESPKTLTS